MKKSFLISLVVSALAVAVAASSSAAGGSSLQRLPGFRSPSGNIRCFVANKLYCSIARSDYAGRLQARCMGPDGAGVDWHGFTLGPSAKGKVYCTSNPPYDTGKQRPSYQLLPYGKTFRRGTFTCSSRVTGITCRNHNGHGLSISRQSWRAW
jgi:surface antigen